MKSDINTLATYPNPMMNFSLGLNNQLIEMQNTVARQCAEAIRSALTPSFAEFAKSLREMQISMAKSLIFAINPLAINFELASYVREAEVVGVGEINDLSVSVEGRFFFKSQLVDTISTNSKHGRLLKLLLTDFENYVSDEETVRELDLMDPMKGIGYVRRDLKDALRDSGLQIDLYREKGKGYRLLGISKLPN
jgi:hypothetical protein